MKIRDVIDVMKRQCADESSAHLIQNGTSRDQVLFGNPDCVCTGIAVCIYPSIEVIRRAVELGCNFIVTHESLFWNHGDQRDWLSENSAFRAKCALLEHNDICVWRNHDCIHAGVKVDGIRRDGIFYGVAERLQWVDYMIDPQSCFPQDYVIPECSARELGKELADTFGLKSVRLIGRPDARVSRVHLPLHIQGRSADRDLISRINDEEINCLIALELVDFTVCEYVRDASSLGENRCIFSVGHFNVEQLGMEWYAGYLRRQLSSSIPVHMISIGDMYDYISNEGNSMH